MMTNEIHATHRSSIMNCLNGDCEGVIVPASDIMEISTPQDLLFEKPSVAMCCDTCYTFYGEFESLDRLLDIAVQMTQDCK